MRAIFGQRGSVFNAAYEEQTGQPQRTQEQVERFTFRNARNRQMMSVTVATSVIAKVPTSIFAQGLIDKTAYYVNGTSGNDTLVVTSGTPTSSGTTLSIQLNNVSRTAVMPAGDHLVINGGNGKDYIRFTGILSTTIEAGLGGGTVYGGSGNDIIYGSNNADMIDGGAGDDSIMGQGGNDSIYGEDGNDTIHGGDGNDFVDGGNGNDVLFGDTGNDVLSGDAGVDTIYSGTGHATLNGGDGNDTLVSVSGTSDSLTGGAGRDTFWYNPTDRVTDREVSETGTVHSISHFDGLSVGGTYVMTPTLAPTTQNLPDPIATDSSGNVLQFKNFSNVPLFSTTGPSENDVNQGYDGDCYFLSPLAAVAKTNPSLIQQSVVALGDGTYAVEFHTATTNHYIRVDADLPVYSDGTTADEHPEMSNTLWAALMEKAWAFYRQGQGTYASINSGQDSEGFAAVGVQSTYNTPTTASSLASYLSNSLNDGYAITLDTLGNATTLVESHTYAVQNVFTSGGTQYVTLRNPWGHDGPGADATNDGYVTLTAASLFNQFSRTLVGYV